MRPHRYLIATGVGLLALAWGSADATVVGVAARPDGLRSQLDARRPLQLVQADDAGRLARFEVRLARIEEELRQLTGRIEQLEFGQRALEGLDHPAWHGAGRDFVHPRERPLQLRAG